MNRYTRACNASVIVVQVPFLPSAEWITTREARLLCPRCRAIVLQEALVTEQ